MVDSYRQTGRTTRQLQAAVAEAKQGKYIFFIVPHAGLVEYVMHLLMDLPCFEEGRSVVRPQRQIVEFKPGCVHVKAVAPSYWFEHGVDLSRGRKDVEIHFDHFFWEDCDAWLQRQKEAVEAKAEDEHAK
jgi:hypothetical protein